MAKKKYLTYDYEDHFESDPAKYAAKATNKFVGYKF